MNFSTLVYGAMIGYVAYKAGEKVEKIRQVSGDENYDVADFVSDLFNNLQESDGLSSAMRTFKNVLS